MGRFWMEDVFVRSQARHLSLKAIAVFVALSCHANKTGKTFIGHRRLGEQLGLNKDSITRAMKELEASGLVRRFKRDNGQASETVLTTVRNDAGRPSAPVRPKEAVKELTKERVEKDSVKLQTLDRLKAKFIGGKFVA